jgi:nucleosome binding factor SPN SPT16 subunit
MYPDILKPKENRRRTHNAESLNGGVPMYIRRRNKNQDQHESYARVALTLPEFRCASVRFHRTLIKSMKRREEEDIERKRREVKRQEGEKKKKIEKGLSRSITVKWGYIECA